MVMLKRTGQESLLNRMMAPSGVVCVAAQDGLWMMGSAHSKRWAQMKQKPKLNRKAVRKRNTPIGGRTCPRHCCGTLGSTQSRALQRVRKALRKPKGGADTC